MINQLILALDTTNLEEAVSISKKIKNKIFTVKLGIEFFNAHGKEGIKKFNEIGINNLMLDLKLKDIPETVYKAIKALDDIEFGFLTIHGQGGKKLIEYAKRAAGEIKSNPKIMMVTILTSLNDNDLKDMGNDSTVVKQVEKLSKIANLCGIPSKTENSIETALKNIAKENKNAIIFCTGSLYFAGEILNLN